MKDDDTKATLQVAYDGIRSTLQSIDEARWGDITVNDKWTIADIAALFAAHAHELHEAMQSVATVGVSTPYLDELKLSSIRFSEKQVLQRRGVPAREILAEIDNAYHRALEMLDSISSETLSKKGTIQWYSADYSLADFVLQWIKRMQRYVDLVQNAATDVRGE